MTPADIPPFIDGFPTFGVPAMDPDVFRALSLLTPWDVDRAKVRIGNPRDGGYVMADGMAGADVLSFGISNDVGFERDIAGRGHRCFMFDHTIERLPEENPGFHWRKLGIAGAGGETADLATLDTILADLPEPSDRLLLKLDVEGAEWDVLSSVPAATLVRFDQIVGEFHWLRRLDEPAFRERVIGALAALSEQFTLFHVHANNCRPLGIVAGFPVADVLELSFVRTSLVERRPSKTIYPAPGDLANNHVVPDHPLLFYPFLPTAPEIVVGDVVRRIMDESGSS